MGRALLNESVSRSCELRRVLGTDAGDGPAARVCVAPLTQALSRGSGGTFHSSR